MDVVMRRQTWIAESKSRVVVESKSRAELGRGRMLEVGVRGRKALE